MQVQLSIYCNIRPHPVVMGCAFIKAEMNIRYLFVKEYFVFVKIFVKILVNLTTTHLALESWQKLKTQF